MPRKRLFPVPLQRFFIYVLEWFRLFYSLPRKLGEKLVLYLKRSLNVPWTVSQNHLTTGVSLVYPPSYSVLASKSLKSNSWKIKNIKIYLKQEQGRFNVILNDKHKGTLQKIQYKKNRGLKKIGVGGNSFSPLIMPTPQSFVTKNPEKSSRYLFSTN